MGFLNRLGSKERVVDRLLPYFPVHSVYVEPFFGAGGMFFSKPRARHNFLNDSDHEVFNLYMVVLEERERLAFELARMPLHQELWDYWKAAIPEDRVLRAVRFLMYSNFGYMGKPDTLHFINSTLKESTLDALSLLDLGDTKFMCMDFEKAIRSVVLRGENDWKEKVFIYADPPYLGTGHNYADGDLWNAGEFSRLLDVLEWRGSKFAVSEFDNPVVIEMAVSRGLEVHTIGSRKNMKNRRVEILLTNYVPSVQGSLF